MTEAFLQYVWQHQLICLDKLYTTNNEPIQVIKIGVFNTNAGPDFLNAKIKIGETIWAGDVEIHKKSSDWNVHQHNSNKLYNSVILHVVATFDKEVFTENGHAISTLVMPILPHVTNNYMQLKDLPAGIRCSKQLQEIDSLRITMFLERLVAERFEQKSEQIILSYHANTNNWEETLYQQLARNFGFKTNNDAFELLAKSIPLQLLSKHQDNSFQIEALLFGQANIWSGHAGEYELSLQKEYRFLQKKYQLTPISPTWWKFARMRPNNFPTFRIAQFAQLASKIPHLASKILESDLDTIKTFFSCDASSFWHTHYSFGTESPKHETSIGKQAIDTIIINTVVPFLFAYGKVRCVDSFRTKAYDILMALPHEHNKTISLWEQHGLHPSNAYETQGLLQLYNNYCTEGKCTRCAIGHTVLNRRQEIFRS
ncbi:MAG: DUF2851 family protein [Bacteroidales bacterium]|nr:DUF2851 family protein [Bacteroidales bacterium]